MTAFLDSVLKTQFERAGMAFSISENIIPPDDSTLFVTAGMQPLRPRFASPDGTSLANIQYCVRTNDLESVGDGLHLTFFKMVGSFGFGTNNYERHVELWHAIVSELGVPVDAVHVHPQSNHRSLWEKRGYDVLDDAGCTWTDGLTGGYCSELFQGPLEIGNLVNPLGHSVDVGFGYERLYQVLYKAPRVDATDLFQTTLDPVARDHLRTLEIFHKQGIQPGNKVREYVCRRLLRRFMQHAPLDGPYAFLEWIAPEVARREKALDKARKFRARRGPQSDFFWWDTFGVLPDEIPLLED